MKPGHVGSSCNSLVTVRMNSLDASGVNATFSDKSSRVRKLASWVGESMNVAPVGESN